MYEVSKDQHVVDSFWDACGFRDEVLTYVQDAFHFKRWVESPMISGWLIDVMDELQWVFFMWNRPWTRISYQSIAISWGDFSHGTIGSCITWTQVFPLDPHEESISMSCCVPSSSPGIFSHIGAPRNTYLSLLHFLWKSPSIMLNPTYRRPQPPLSRPPVTSVMLLRRNPAKQWIWRFSNVY